ncbi:MAG: hypothetical protein AAFR15_01400, partial [Cyanobacteria bacterium J06627_15]
SHIKQSMSQPLLVPHSPKPATASHQFWQDLSAEFAFEGINNAQVEQDLIAITETWMVCMGEWVCRPMKGSQPRRQSGAGQD